MPRSQGPGLVVLFGITLSIASPILAADPKESAEFFEKEVRPLLIEKCQKCHGDEGKPKGGLKLTSRAAVLAGGATGPAAVPGKPDESAIVQAVRYIDEPKMPPRGKLADRDIATLSRWVELGLPWPDAKVELGSSSASISPKWDESRKTWAFRPPVEPTIPRVNSGSWPKTEIDRFILAKLEAAGLKPASPADKRTLIRRASFDLIGLPPTPEEVEAFLKDESPDAFTRVVDRLLASPAYGERWARSWLDVVRYADSLDARGSGGPGDILDAWRYRDWVVEAMNSDVPYDRFVREQVAGDLLPPASASEGDPGFNRSGTIATTMLAIGNWGNGDADKDKILTDIADDQVDVVSKAFLGLTVSCARCHDHKFDPISQADYYGMAGIFFSTHILPGLTPKGQGEGIIRVPLISPAEQGRQLARDRRIAELEKSLKERRAGLYRDLALSLKPEASRYLQAAWDYQARPDTQRGQTVADFASKRGLLPFALKRWIGVLGGGEVNRLGNRMENVGGTVTVGGWNGGATGASITANPTALAQQIATFRLPPRSISVHPGPKSAAVVSWRSPISGKVRVTGRIADGDDKCGDGVGWVVRLRSALGSAELASGEVGNGGGMALGQGKDADSLASIAVKAGEALELVILPRGEYSCDTTTVDLVISSWDGPASWDLTRDCAEDIGAGNPHADRLGHPAVWEFGDLPNPRPPGGPMAAALLRGNLADRADREKAADSLVKTFPLDTEASPFWIEDPADESALPAEARATLRADEEELARLRSEPVPPVEFANAAQDGGVPGSPHAGVHDVKIHFRGRYDRLGDLVPRRFPTILAGDDQPPIRSGSGRVELANWLTRPDNPLTARVIVNRIWQGHFGRGIVGTPSNFGKLGDPPSHPELLDWLAVRFVRDGWSMKKLHRMILLSAVYQQGSSPTADDLRIDGDNRLLSRQNRRRLEAEAIRDDLLSASGRLDRTRGGPPVRDPNAPRRGLYVVTIRSDRSTVAALFDQADSTAPVDRRAESTVAPQSLYLLNSPFVIAQADALARRLAALPGDDRGRITRACEILYARPASAEEIAIGLHALNSPGEPKESGWKAYCQVLLCANEMIYIE